MGKSNDAVLVLNAGSSSIKLSVFAQRAGELALELRGEVEGLYTAPRSWRTMHRAASSPRGHGAERRWVTMARSSISVTS